MNFVDAVENEIHDLHSFMLLRHGAVVAEGWWSPYAPDRPHMLFSLSKSFTSTAVGFAVTEGRLSIDDPVISFFPEIVDPVEATRSNPHLAAMRVRHLLSMSTGHAEDPTGIVRSAANGQWTKAFLESHLEYEPGTHFVYNSLATYMLSAIVQKVTGMKLIDYLRPRLFQPLGITGAFWESSPEKINTGGWGLNIKTEDIARFGQLYLQKGQWQGRRILPEHWVEQATAFQIANGDDPESDWAQGYGFQFWRCRHGAYRGDGAFGQFCVVMPEQDAVLAITSGLDDMQAVLNLVWQHLLPGMTAGVLPEAPQEFQNALVQRLSSLTIHPPVGDPATLVAAAPLAAGVSGKTYRFDENPYRLRSVSFQFTAEHLALSFLAGRSERLVAYGQDHWLISKTSVNGAQPRWTAAAGRWSAPDVFIATLRYFETPFVDTFTFRFSEDGKTLHVDGVTNVSFGEKAFLTLTGHMEG
jgi:CubicO group peptidase (beta-lactamase class C family)